MSPPFAPHDEVVIDGHQGSVVSLSARATVLMTLDGNYLRIPNALVFRSVMLNYTRNPSRRFEFDVGVGVQEALIEAQRLGVETLGMLDGVMVKPPPRGFIQSLGDSNVQIRYFGWVDQRTHDFLSVRSEAIRVVKLALEAAGMHMPEPIYRLQLSGASTHSVEARSTTPEEVTSAARTSPRSPPTRATQAVVDTSRVSDLDEQITHDRARSDTADLLNPKAPRE